MRPENILVSGSKITLGLTEEQKDEEMQRELEKRRVEASNYKNQLEDRLLGKRRIPTENSKLGLQPNADTRPLSPNERLRVVHNTENYIEKYEHILREREDEERWQKDRFARFSSM